MAAWDITQYAYSGTALSISGQTTAPEDIVLKDDGAKAFVLNNSSDTVLEYALSTAWDISTGTFTTSLSISGQEFAVQGLAFGNSGAKMYVVGAAGDDVNEYDLSTAWDVSSATFNQLFDISGQDTFPRSIKFNDAGTKMFILGGSGNDINEYTLSTAWDVSTASFVDAFSIASQTTTPTSMAFGDSGSKVYVADQTTIYQYDLSTAFDISTASYVDSFDVSGQDTFVQGVFFRTNGNNFYTSGTAGDAIYQYILVTTISATAAITGTSTLAAIPAVISGIASIAGDGTLSGVGAAIQPAPSRAIDEASAGGTSAALSVSLNSAITEPANPSGNT
jgi:hypothetical protein